ncbi:MAG: (Fe-S)-binding protein [Bacteroidetes bacterium]|nr:(Fe-S)-binding protein [Bacteroidota bacterium]
MKNTQNKFAPGCALMLYKPELAKKVHTILNNSIGVMDLHLTCCRHTPDFTQKANIINICPGCNKRYKNDYEQTTTESLWEILAELDDFPFPDYKGESMTILDACPTRDEDKIHNAIRLLLSKMNINVIEPAKTRKKGKCCGDTFYGVLSISKVKEQMKNRADEMPVSNVVVYCVSCTKAVFIGGKRPRYLIDLLFNEKTIKKTIEPDIWHKELDVYISEH